MLDRGSGIHCSCPHRFGSRGAEPNDSICASSTSEYHYKYFLHNICSLPLCIKFAEFHISSVITT